MVAALLGSTGATAQPAAPPVPAPVAAPPAPAALDFDNDGDIDADDRKALEALEVVEIEDKSAGRKLVESARPVTVIDTKQARERTADLGEVLSRTQGIQVRRSGGLGASTRFSLNGLYDDQIRFFLDGIPLALAGWDGGVADLPPDLVDRVDVHRGVVPIALSADALGGAIDLITNPSWASRAAASYQVGSFGTHRASISARAKDAATGAGLSMSFSVDRAANDYPIEVEIADTAGKLRNERVRRFHDAYQAVGGALEAGVVERGWLRRALVRIYVSQVRKDLQHNTAVTAPYGDADYATRNQGGHVDLAAERGRWTARLVLGGGRQTLNFRDLGHYIYDWYGNKQSERPGIDDAELGGQTNALYTTTAGFARMLGEYKLSDRNTLRLAIGPSFELRRAKDFVPHVYEFRNPLEARRELRRVISGLEHELRLTDDLENIAFIKHYALWNLAEDISATGQFFPIDDLGSSFGFGDAVRWRITKQLWIKASYEHSTRLPTVDEMFGDGIYVQPNLALEPEVSHNANLGVHAERQGRLGEVALEVDSFLRRTDQLIFLSGVDRAQRFQNVYGAQVIGIEAGVSYSTPGEWASIEGSGTLQEIRNNSSSGPFAEFDGDHIPNRPLLLASLSATLRARDLVLPDDQLSLFGSTRYVDSFYRSWESLGRQESKTAIPSQLVTSVGITYARRGNVPVVTTFEVQNITNEQVFDAWRVERPGRALYVKVSTEL